MTPSLRPLNEQTIVLTGATSGIGLATARLAARRGARLFLTSRNGDDLARLCAELSAAGTVCDFHAADVAERGGPLSVARACVDRFGGFDTWVNNAGVSVYGPLEETQLEDARRIFDTNFWGLVEGSLEAVKVMEPRGGGALINVGSVLSDVAIPMQGFYDASKHAVRGFTDALRRELKARHAPISVSLVKPGAIDTPYTEHAKSLLQGEPTHTPPVYSPDVVARAILECATSPIRVVGVGSSAFLYPLLDGFLPRLQDFVMSRFLMADGQRKEFDPGHVQANEALHRPPGHELEERGNYEGHVFRSSAATRLELEFAKHPVLSALVGLGLAAGVGVLMKNRHKIADGLVRYLNAQQQLGA